MPPCLRVRLEPQWAEAVEERERARIQDEPGVLRRGGVVCPDFDDRFLAQDPSRTTLALTEWQAEATVPLQAQPAREFQGRLGELAEYLQDLALTGHRVFLAGLHPGHARPPGGDPAGIRAAGGLRHPGRLPGHPPAPVRRAST